MAAPQTALCMAQIRFANLSKSIVCVSLPAHALPAILWCLNLSHSCALLQAARPAAFADIHYLYHKNGSGNAMCCAAACRDRSSAQNSNHFFSNSSVQPGASDLSAQKVTSGHGLLTESSHECTTGSAGPAAGQPSSCVTTNNAEPSTSTISSTSAADAPPHHATPAISSSRSSRCHTGHDSYHSASPQRLLQRQLWRLPAGTPWRAVQLCSLPSRARSTAQRSLGHVAHRV